MASIRPRVAPRDIFRDAVVKMDALVAAFSFSIRRSTSAARQFVERYRKQHPQQPRATWSAWKSTTCTGLRVL